MSRAAVSAIPSVVDAVPSTEREPHYEAIVGTLVRLADGEGAIVELETASGEILRRTALSTVELDARAVGHPVLLMFVGGDLDRPVITGRVQPGRASPRKTTRTRTLVLDGRELVLEADSSLTLRCGKSSITLTREGRIVLRGTNVVSHASGVNRIRGGTIKLN